jgi:predicted transcriptional regulator YheO
MARSEGDTILASIVPVVEGIAATLGPHAEVVLHDFRRPDSSIIAIAGSLTDRHIGGSMSQIGMDLIARGNGASNELNYSITAADGRRLRSSTFPLRDSKGVLVGALCINLDVTDIERATAVLASLVGPQEVSSASAVTFSDDIDDVVESILAATELSHGSAKNLDPRARLAFIRDLDQQGVFSVRKAAPRVAEHLGISRASLYSDLQKARERTSPKDVEIA